MGSSHRSGPLLRIAAWSVVKIAVALGLVAVFSVWAQAFGLRTPFVEVNLGCLEPGSTYSVVEKRNLPLSVTNLGQDPVELTIEALQPRPDELLKGYEAIPGTGWIRLKKNRFHLMPGKIAITDVLVAVPDDSRYLGHHYQVWLWSHTVGRAGVTAGLKSRLLFSVCKE